MTPLNHRVMLLAQGGTTDIVAGLKGGAGFSATQTASDERQLAIEDCPTSRAA